MHRYCYHKERNYIFSYSQIVSYRALSDERPFFVLSTQSRKHCDIPLINKRRFSRRTASLYSNKRMVVVSERSFSFKKVSYFPHSYDMEHPLIIGILHIFDIILFLHQTTTYKEGEHCQKELYIILFLHQTTTLRPILSRARTLYIILFLHQTTTYSFTFVSLPPLYIILFLHQTTTGYLFQ